MLKLTQKNSEISAENVSLKDKIRADMDSSSAKYAAKCSELDYLRKQHSILRNTNTQLTSLLTRHSGSAYARTIDFPKKSNFSSATNSPPSPSTLGVSMDDLRSQLLEAQSRAAIAEEDARIARHDTSTIRRQYLDRVVESRGEVNAILNTQGQQYQKRCRASGVNLLAHLVHTTMHTKPIRRAFLQWVGHAGAKRVRMATKCNAKTLRELEVENIALSRTLRASEMSNRMLEGRIASNESSITQNRVDVPTKLGSVGRTQDLRVKMLEHELSRSRREHQHLKSKHAQFIVRVDQEKTFQMTEEIRNGLAGQTPVIPNQRAQILHTHANSTPAVAKQGEDSATVPFPHELRATQLHPSPGIVHPLYREDETKNGEMRRRSANFLGFGVSKASRVIVPPEQQKKIQSNNGNASTPADYRKHHQGVLKKNNNDLLDRINTGRGRRRKKEAQKEQRHHTTSKKNWGKKGRQRRRKSLILQKVV